MKLASLKDGSLDGQLVVVSDDLHTAAFADAVAPTLQRALEDWHFFGPQLQTLYEALNQGRVRRAFEFDARDCHAPLPRAYRVLAADCYADHARVLAEAGEPSGGAEARAPAGRRRAATVPGTSDDLPGHDETLSGDWLAGARAEIVCDRPDASLDCSAYLTAVCDAVPRGASAARALAAVRLLGLACRYAYREGPAGQRDVKIGFSPVFVSPDEFGAAWLDGRLHRTLSMSINGRALGSPDCAAGLTVGAGTLLAAQARQRPLTPGTVYAMGPVAAIGRSHALGSIAGRRAVETITAGAATTPFLVPGDRVALAFAPPERSMSDAVGADARAARGEPDAATARQHVCGLIEHTIVEAESID
nr:fumarylacetoacetate hydrolase family protein [Chitinasiproducens palmae]